MSSCPLSHTFHKWSTLIGLFVLLIPNGLPWYWGNLMVYATSYVIRNAPVISESEIEGPWTMASFEVGACLGVFVAAFLINKIGKRCTMLFGMLLCLVSIFGAYFAMDFSLLAMNIFLGLFSGLGMYATNGVVIAFTAEWADGDFGLLNGFVQSGNVIGSIFMNLFLTTYINPRNLSPNFFFGSSYFFSQDEVIERVPTLFLSFAGIHVGTFAIGILMVRHNTQDKKKNLKKGTEAEVPKVHYGAISDSDDINNRNRPKIVTISNKPEITFTDKKINEHPHEMKPNGLQHPHEMTPKDLMSSCSMYALSALALFGQLNYLVLANYYKLYGQIHISDDHFIANMSIPLMLAITVSRPCVGKLFDRFGQRRVFVLYFSTTAITSVWFYFSPIIDKWCFLVMTLGYGVTANVTYILTACTCLKQYGEKNFLINYSLILVPPTLGAIAASFVFALLLANFGWFSIYLACSACCLVGLCYSAAFFPS